MFKSSRNEESESFDEPLGNSVGKLLLRLTLGGMMLFHGIHKIQHGIAGVEGMLEGAGLPAAMGYGVYFGEIVVPILLILGLWTRLSSLAMAATMAMAIFLAHRSHLLMLGEFGEWKIEPPMMFLLPALALMLLGPGAFALGRKTGILA